MPKNQFSLGLTCQPCLQGLIQNIDISETRLIVNLSHELVTPDKPTLFTTSIKIMTMIRVTFNNQYLPVMVVVLKALHFVYIVHNILNGQATSKAYKVKLKTY